MDIVFLEKNPSWTALLGPERLLNFDFFLVQEPLKALLQAFYSTEHEINEQFYPTQQSKSKPKFLPLVTNQKHSKTSTLEVYLALDGY